MDSYFFIITLQYTSSGARETLLTHSGTYVGSVSAEKRYIDIITQVCKQHNISVNTSGVIFYHVEKV